MSDGISHSHSVPLHSWLRRLRSPPILAVVIGCLAGLSAVGFDRSLHFIQSHVLRQLGGYPFAAEGPKGILPPFLFILIPAIGGLLVGLLIQFVVPEAEGPGTDGLVQAFHEEEGQIRARVPIGKGVATLLTLGTGGSAGQEGPIAQIGGGIGSQIGNWLKVKPDIQRILMLAGTAGGLGAIFQAPLGGALTACEILYREDFESEAFQPAVIASVIGFAFYRLSMPNGPFLEVPHHALLSWRELIAAAIFGVGMVPLSWLFTRCLAVAGLLFQVLKMPNFMKPALGGAILGVIGLTIPEAIGTGWDTVREAANGLHLGSFLMLVLFMKMITTSITLGSGGSGGLFGPSLFLGAMIGSAYGSVGNQWFPAFFPDPNGFALVGMGAFFAGAAKAPLAGIVMVCEMTGNYSLLPALLLASASHYGLSRTWTIYPSQRETRRQSPAHRHSFRANPLREVSVAESFDWDPYPFTIHPETPLAALSSSAFRSNPDDWPVVDDNGKLMGVLTLNNVVEALGNPMLEQGLIVEDVMEPPAFITPDQDLGAAMELLHTKGWRRVPVLDIEGNLVGSIDALHILRASEKSLKSGPH